MHFSRWWKYAGLLIALIITACQSSPTPTALPDARDLLNRAAQEIRVSSSLKIKLQLSGAPSYVDPPANRIAFVSADGAYSAPDKVAAKVVAKILGIAGEVEIIAIGDDQWYQNKILTAGKFIKQIFAPGFSAAKLISSNVGIESALKAIKELKMIGRESLNGISVYHLAGTADGKDIEALTVGLIHGQIVNADIYINTDPTRVERVVLVQPDTVTEKEPNPTQWDLEIYDYNMAVAISPPSMPVATAPATAPAAAMPTAPATASS